MSHFYDPEHRLRVCWSLVTGVSPDVMGGGSVNLKRRGNLLFLQVKMWWQYLSVYLSELLIFPCHPCSPEDRQQTGPGTQCPVTRQRKWTHGDTWGATVQSAECPPGVVRQVDHGMVPAVECQGHLTDPWWNWFPVIYFLICIMDNVGKSQNDQCKKSLMIVQDYIVLSVILRIAHKLPS